MPELAQEIRAFLVEKVSATGGHLGAVTVACEWQEAESWGKDLRLV